MVRPLESKIIPPEKLASLSARLREEGKRIVTTNGCFDFLHLGHIQYLMEAKALGDILICGLNSDSSVRGLKGAGRPVFDEKVRALQLAGLETVDYVSVFSEKTPERFLELARPHIHVKGGDYRPDQLPERGVVEAGGGQVRCLSLVQGFSTTSLIAKLKLLTEKE